MEQHEERCTKYGERIASLEAHMKNYISIITRIESKSAKGGSA
jgi:hypothetical protein